MDSRGESPQLALPGLEAPVSPWSVRRSARSRRISVRVFHDGRVEIVAPSRATERRIEDFVAAHREWIELRSREGQRRAAGAEAAFPPAELPLAAFAECWRLHCAGGTGPLRIRTRPDRLLEVKGDGGAESGGRKGLQQVLRRWLIERARLGLEPWLADVAAECGFRYERLQVRLQRTRWGSCSVRGTISLNACLAFQRPEIVRYLLIHELAHTHHMNHSARFRDCVAQHCPQWRTLDRELLEGWHRVPRWVFP